MELRIAGAPDAVAMGYGVYLLYSILILRWLTVMPALATLGLAIQVPIAVAAIVLSVWMLAFGVHAATERAA